MKTRFFVMCITLLGGVMLAHAQGELDTDALELLLEDYVYEDEPGVVLYVGTPDDTWIGAMGSANLDTSDAIQTDDLFRIGSATKPFVATVVLQLVEEGELALDAPIADYLPDDVVSNVENADTATVRQMLQMTSGIFNYTESDAFNDAVEADPAYGWTASETVETVFGEEAYFAPGEDYYYSNTNYNLAEMIISDITGQSLADAIDERIFSPLGMASCFVETPDRFAEGIVRGYEYYDADDYDDITDYNDGVGMGDGGIVCNAEDLAKFLPGLLYEGLLSDAMLEEMAATVDDDYGGQYGLGIGYDDSEFGWLLGHDGATSGFQSAMAYLEDEDIVIVILTNNFESEIVEDLTYEALAIALGEY